MAKIIREQTFNAGILESYKPEKNLTADSFSLGSFRAKGMTAENVLNKNGRKYSTEVWNQPGSFGKGGTYIDENGKLKPASLFGSVDHPEDRAEVTIQEIGIGWKELTRNEDGTWDGVADILNTPSGRIAKVVLDYAKSVGGGDLLGVSSRAVAESGYYQGEDGQQYEEIVAEGFELKTFDLVFNPSFSNKAITESTKRKTLFESINKLADADKEHEQIYKTFLESLKGDKDMNKKTNLEGKSLDAAKTAYLRELKDREKKLHDMVYDLEKMTPEEFAKQYDQPLDVVIAKLKKEYGEIKQAIEDIENPVMQGARVEEQAKVKTEDMAEDLEALLPDDAGSEDGEEDGEEESDDEESEEDELDEEGSEEDSKDGEEAGEEEAGEEEVTLASLAQEIAELKTILQDIRDAVAPLESPESEVGEEDLAELDLDLTDEEEGEEESKEDDPLADLSEEDLDNLTDEELEYLKNQAEAK